MTKPPPDTPPSSTPADAVRAERARRLAAALRDNLKRRKAGTSAPADRGDAKRN